MEQTQKNFTYIFGAGASIETIPVVNDIPGGLHDFCVDMDKVIVSTKGGRNILKELRTTCEEIKETIKNVKSFDTYAKKLWLSSEITKYNKYRRAFSAFIMYRSLAYNIDRRYDLFFASLINKIGGNISLPNNINIISWNYDQLVEISLCHLLRISSSELAQNINIYSNYIDLHQTNENNRLSLFKLNGTAGKAFKYDDIAIRPINDQIDFLNEKKQLALNKVLDYYKFLRSSDMHKLEIDFAWSDEHKYIEEHRNEAKKIIEKTDYLIIIGYSFPTFNRMVDFELLKGLKKSCKIHLQIPESDINAVKQRLLAVTQKSENNINIFSHIETDEFYIPYEFNIPSKPSFNAFVI